MRRSFCKAFLILCFSLLISVSFSQINVGKYFDIKSLELQLGGEFQKIEFKWTLPADLQIEMNEGLNAIEERSFEVAKSHFDSVLQKDLQFLPAYYYRGVANKILRDYGAAEFDFKKAAQLESIRAQAWIEMGDIKYLQKVFTKAKDFYEKALEIQPNSVTANLKLGILSVKEGNTRLASKYFIECNKIDSRFPNSYLALALLKFREKGKWSEAISDFSKVIEVDSSFASAYFWRGLAYINSKDSIKGLNDWGQAVQLDKMNTFYGVMHGFLLIELGKFDDAFRDFRRVLKMRYIEENKYNFVATTFDKQVEFQNLADYLVKYGYGLPDNAFSKIKEGFCLLLVGKNEASLRALKESASIQTSTCSLYNQAVVFERLSNYDSAISYYKKVLQEDNNIFEVHKKLSLLCYERSDWRGAFSHLAYMKRIQPSNVATWRLSSQIKLRLDDNSGAMLEISKYLEKDSTDAEAWGIRAAARTNLDDLKGANEDLTKALELQPNTLHFILSKASNCLTLNDTTQALQLLKKAKTDFFGNDKYLVRLALANAFLQSGLVDMADTEVTLIIKETSKFFFLQTYYAGARFIRCKLMAQKGKANQALKAVNALIDQYNTTGEYIFFRVNLLLERGEVDKAKEDLKVLKDMKYKKANDLCQKYAIR